MIAVVAFNVVVALAGQCELTPDPNARRPPPRAQLEPKNLGGGVQEAPVGGVWITELDFGIAPNGPCGPFELSNATERIPADVVRRSQHFITIRVPDLPPGTTLEPSVTCGTNQADFVGDTILDGGPVTRAAPRVVRAHVLDLAAPRTEVTEDSCHDNPGSFIPSSPTSTGARTSTSTSTPRPTRSSSTLGFCHRALRCRPKTRRA